MEITKQDITGAIEKAARAEIGKESIAKLVESAVENGILFTSDKPIMADVVSITADTPLYRGTVSRGVGSFIESFGRECEYVNSIYDCSIEKMYVHPNAPVNANTLLSEVADQLSNYSVARKKGFRELELNFNEKKHSIFFENITEFFKNYESPALRLTNDYSGDLAITGKVKLLEPENV